MSRASTQQMLRQIPVSWAIGLLVLLVSYWFAQPILNSRLGLQLPSLASLLGEPEPKPKLAEKKVAPPPSKSSTDESSSAEDTQSTTTAEATKPSAQRTDMKSSAKPKKADTDAKKPSAKSTSETTAKQPASDNSSELLHGLLKETGRERYVSPEGLQYNPGSEEGHRLQHLERHLKDQPNRPGKHGVFDGDMPQVLKWIDDAYARGKRGAKGVRKQEEDGRTVYEVPFSQPIGYIGGRDGKRDGHPAAKRLRLVVDGNRFITAFPF